jgi:diguanylate cyclase (GGDEF)-like protein
MLPPPIPADETLRLATLKSLDILDTAPEERFDRLTRLARRLFGVPIALVSLVDADRQWFKSCYGLEDREAARSTSFCGHAIVSDDILLVPDALEDVRFHDNPVVTGDPLVRFYAGRPLAAGNGTRLGTLCLIDTRPRDFGAEDCALLHDLANMAEQELAAVQLASMDDLTGLSNRRGFSSLGQYALGTCLRQDRPATLLFFDMDGFKPVNDRFGHAEGDRALTAFGGLLRESLRQSDVVARIGGDEFAVLLSGCSPADEDAALARLRQAVDRWNAANALGYGLAYSIGRVAFDARRHAGVDALLAEADAAMYADKTRRRGGRH